MFVFILVSFLITFGIIFRYFFDIEFCMPFLMPFFGFSLKMVAKMGPAKMVGTPLLAPKKRSKNQLMLGPLSGPNLGPKMAPKSLTESMPAAIYGPSFCCNFDPPEPYLILSNHSPGIYVHARGFNRVVHRVREKPKFRDADDID